MSHYLSIGAFGLIGVFLRYGIDRWIPYEPGAFPVSTFSINLIGSTLAGVLYVLSERQSFSPAIQVGLLIGLCGGFTTFSAYVLQTIQMTDKDRLLPALAYFTLSPVLSFLIAFFAVLMTRKFLT